MRLTPSLIWCISLGFVALLWILFPVYRWASALVLAAQAAVLVWGVFDIRSQFFGSVPCSRPRERQALALTFDDGPDPALTATVLDLLKRYGYHATFFVVAETAAKFPDLVRRAADEGHTIACHDLHHSPWSNFRMGDTIVHEVGRAQEIIAGIIGRKPLLYRPPVGLMNPHVLPALRRLEMRCIGWSRRAGEAGNRRLERIERIASLAGPGEVILLHDTLPVREHREAFLKALRALLEDIKSHALEPQTIDTFFGIPAYA